MKAAPSEAPPIAPDTPPVMDPPLIQNFSSFGWHQYTYASGPTHSANFEEARRGLVQQENAWVVFTVIGASILITLIAIFALYDLCNRFREFVNQQIFDGGPPASPGHQASYTLQIQVEEASASFDTKKTVLKVEFLDHLNQFITNIVVPFFLFKFGARNKRRAALAEPPSDSPPIVQLPGPPPPNAFAQAGLNPNLHRSLTAYYETWQNLVRSNSLSFSLVRRQPMLNLTSIRLSHDCFATDAQVTLKHVIIRDDARRTGSRVDLHNKPLRALHICPPSSFQVFPAEPMDSVRELGESRSWVQLMTTPEIVALLLVYYQLALAFSPFTYQWLHGRDDIKSCLLLGLAVAGFTVLVSSLLLSLYLYLRRPFTNPFKLSQPSTLFLILTLTTCALLCFYALYKIFQLKKEHASFALHLILILLVAATSLTLLLIAATAALAFFKVSPHGESPRPPATAPTNNIELADVN